MSVGAVNSMTPPGVTDGGRRGRRRRHGRPWLKAVAFGLSILVTAAVISTLILGMSYQPVGFGGSGAALTGGIVQQRINNLPPMAGQIYLPPQKAASGAILVSLTNTGPLAVTIKSASLNNPDHTTAADLHAEPVRDSGPATYWLPSTNPDSGNGTTLADTVLQPGQTIMVRLPVTAAGCWLTSGGYMVESNFWVRVGFLYWDHLIRVGWTSPFDQSSGAIVAHEPEPVSQGGTCPS